MGPQQKEDSCRGGEASHQFERGEVLAHLHFVLFLMNKRRWRGRLLTEVVREGKKHEWVWGIP
jgi:hypothetical protein